MRNGMRSETSLIHSRRALVALLVLMAAIAAVTPVPPALAADDADSVPALPPITTLGEGELYDMIFPVVGDNRYSDTYGAPRSGGRTHKGVDIMADKMTPIVAVADGTVGWIHDEQGGDCCAMSLNHDDGWVSYYIHMNNDTPGTDDGLGWGFADGIAKGVHVEAGQLIGWVGDSGNAESTAPHLHFELHQPGVGPINPTPHVDAAVRLTEPGGTPVGHYEGRFSDDDNSVHEANIDRMAELGITRGCNPPANDRYCPGSDVTRGQIAAFLRRFFDLPAATVDYFTDDDESIFEEDINAVVDAGIGFGCAEDTYCPGAALRREEMAELLVRAFSYGTGVAPDYFVDDETSEFQVSINALRHVGVTVGCNPPASDRFCPTEPMTRAQMATFIIRAIDLAATTAD